jgi:putative hemolysin
MNILLTTLIPLLFLIGTFFLTTSSSALRALRNTRSKEELNEHIERFPFLRIIRAVFGSAGEEENLLLATLFSQTITRFAYVFSFSFVLLYYEVIDIKTVDTITLNSLGWHWLIIAGGFFLFAIISLVFSDFLPRSWGSKTPIRAIQVSAIPTSIFLALLFPGSSIFLFLTQKLNRIGYFQRNREAAIDMRDKIMEMIEESEEEDSLDSHDKDLIESALTFRNRIVREIMVPRVDIFALPAETTIRAAAKAILEEKFSRVPVYRESIDQVIGILMHRDLLNVYIQWEENKKNGEKDSLLDQSIETLIKPPLFTPETKKVPDLLQELRSKQTHLAIVVDEYGGTEGVITIEDMLEEIVGDIEDEYDEGEILFVPHPEGGWMVDARMPIHEIEDELEIEIPQATGYDTLAGYLFHKAGAIPEKGMRFHHDNFEIEILESTERTVEKVRITPIKSGLESDESEENNG